MFDLYQMRCFIAIAEERHFGRAAARLHITQPPLSRQLALLESHLGVKLALRSSQGVELTMAGSVFLKEAQQLLRLADEAAATTRLAAQGQLGHLSIGFTAAAAFDLLPALIRGLRDLHPHIGLTLREMVTFAQTEQLSEGKLDAGLVRPSFDLSRFAALRLATDRLVVALPAAHPLARRKRLRLADFHEQPFIGHSPVEAQYFYDILSDLFKRDGVHPHIVQSLAQPNTMLSMVRAGLGMAIVANTVARNATKAHITFRELDADTPPIEMWLIWRKANHSPTLRNLVKIAEQVVRRSGPQL